MRPRSRSLFSSRKTPDPFSIDDQQRTSSYFHKSLQKGLVRLCAALVLLLFASRFCSAANTRFTLPVPLTDTTYNIHLGMTHDSRTSADAEEGIIDYVWGARIPQRDHHIHKSFYFKFDRAGGYEGNTAFPFYYDRAWFARYHPDWLVYLCNRTSLAYEFGDPNVPLDITNPEVLQFMLKTWLYPALDIGYDGIAFDNVNLDNTQSAGRCGIWRTDAKGHRYWRYLYGDAVHIHGPLYALTVVNWARFMYRALHRYAPGATMEMNFCPNNGGVSSQSLAFNKQLLPYMDFSFNEGGYTLHGGYTTDANWQLEAQFSRALSAQGKGQLLTFGFPYTNLTQEKRLWAIANYLLVKGPHTYLYIASTAGNGSNYGTMNLLPEYMLSIGHPLNDFYFSHGTAMRDYSNGKVIVNFSSRHEALIPLPNEAYNDLYDNPINGLVSLPAHSGLVLLKV